MAWATQAWRHSLAGLPDPSQADTEQQWRLSLVNVANASDLFEPVAWDYDEMMTLVATPLPDTGFDVTTRYAVANVPAVNLADGINRDGSVTPTLSGFTVDFDGTITIPTFDGSVSATLSGFTPSFVGEFGFRHYFDISYSITPTWVVLEQPARFGDIGATLGGFTVA